ncbi:transferase [Paenibacillus tritici]|jgi:acetyltransferase-like isoleucine patch superfamily enzyme|uniref:Transferase n=1 Tax=Paenibacillus tritici TaxID=1873425 RepID=A0ABX2DX63_9BACL|nr:DapH/DapD/GlmU-related protein [Paenibacillus tritici]NQX49290.1 transferase [Paenibacillus tritici]QUL53267.1 transferase [Paenibacillus tritici]
MKQWKSEGSGEINRRLLGSCGDNVIFEDGVRIFHPENVHLGDNVYIGHNTILKGYYKHELRIGSHSWIGPGCFLHGAGGLYIGEYSGIGPAVRIHGATHIEGEEPEAPMVFAPLTFTSIQIEENCNIGIGATILGGVTIGAHSRIGAGAVVSRTVPAYSVAVGIPAKVIRHRNQGTADTMK